jgi:hypothetical protein
VAPRPSEGSKNREQTPVASATFSRRHTNGPFGPDLVWTPCIYNDQEEQSRNLLGAGYNRHSFHIGQLSMAPYEGGVSGVTVQKWQTMQPLTKD